MKICSAETPHAAAEHLRPWFARHFAAAITGEPGSGKTTAVAHIIHAAVEAGLPLHRIAAYAPTHRAAERLREIVGSFWPDEPVWDLFEPGMSGTPLTAAQSRRFEQLDRWHREAVDEFTALIKHVGEIGDNKKSLRFLRRRRSEIHAAIAYDIDARLNGGELPMIAWFHEIADFYREFKHRRKLVDIADLYVEPLEPMTKCPLLVLDEIKDARDRALLLRIYPNASTVTVGADPGADIVIQLG